MGLLSAKKLHVGGSNLQRVTAVKSFSSTPTRNDAASGESSTQEEKIIYTGGLTSQIKALKIFSLTTSAIGLGVQPLVWTHFLAKYGTGATIGTFSMVAFFTAVTPLMIHYIAKKYVTELYFDKNNQTYKAITFSFLLGRVEVRIKCDYVHQLINGNVHFQTTFKQEDVERPDMLGMFEAFRVNGKSLFVDPSQFPDPVDYVKLMGYDKPMDFTYYEDKEKQQKK